MATSPPNFIVGIGGSAGALNAYKALLKALPANTGMAFVVVSHITPTANSQLAEILSRHTKMTVRLAGTAMPIEANHVYICPPNADLLIESNTFKVVSPRTKRNIQVDLFLTSLAEAMGRVRSALSSRGMMATVLRDASRSRRREEQPLPRICLPK